MPQLSSWLVHLRRIVHPGVSPDRLWRLTEYAQESLTHAPAIRKTGFLGHLIDRMAGLFHHQSRRFKAKIFNGLGGGLSGLGPEGAAELPWTQMRRFRQLLDG
jgi:hypothetical protein